MIRLGLALLVAIIPLTRLVAQETEILATLQEIDPKNGSLRVAVGGAKPETKDFNLAKKDLPVHHVLGHALKLEDLKRHARLALKINAEDVLAIRDDSDCIWGHLGQIDASNRTIEIQGQLHLRIPMDTPIKGDKTSFEQLKPGYRVQIIFASDKNTIAEIRTGNHLPAVNPYTRIATAHVGVILKVDAAERRLQYLATGPRNQLHELACDKRTQVRMVHENRVFAETSFDQLAPHVNARVTFEADTKKALEIDVSLPIIHGIVHKLEDRGRKVWLAPFDAPEKVEGPFALREDARIVLALNQHGLWGHLEEKSQVMLGLAPNQQDGVYIRKLTPESHLRITVAVDDWGGAPPSNIQAVCDSVAREMRSFLPRRSFDPIVINRSKESPITLFGKTDKGERRVKLNVGGNFWAQFAYQFGHEFGHILCNYRAAKNSNLWFEESMCEAVSIFAIQRMSKSWRERPPYPNWKTYAGSLEDYANNYRRTVGKMDEAKFLDWFEKKRDALQKIDRPACSVVAVQALLPLLEKNPEHWGALNWLNQSDPERDLSFAEYLADWHRRVPEVHKSFVADIAKTFKIALPQK